MTLVNREKFLQALCAVQAGLTPKEIIEQSSAFAFLDGEVYTYNGEVTCHMPSLLDKGVKGAVQAKPLLAILGKMAEEEVEVEVKGGELAVSGKGRKSGIRMEADVLMPLSDLEGPEGWGALHEDFADAVSVASRCAGKDQSQFRFTCLHLHPDWVEACDNTQLCRYKLPTGLASSVLVKKDSLRHVTSLDVTEFAQTASWLHFRNPSGLVFSCRKYLDEYEDLTPFLKRGQGTSKASLPKGLVEALDRAEVFSADNAEDNKVLIELTPGKLRVRGQGVTGWYEERRKVAYLGPKIAFYVSPKLLAEVTKRHNEVELTNDKLRVKGGKWTYVACLTSVEAVEALQAVEVAPGVAK